MNTFKVLNLFFVMCLYLYSQNLIASVKIRSGDDIIENKVVKFGLGFGDAIAGDDFRFCYNKLGFKTPSVWTDEPATWSSRLTKMIGDFGIVGDLINGVSKVICGESWINSVIDVISSEFGDLRVSIFVETEEHEGSEVIIGRRPSTSSRGSGTTSRQARRQATSQATSPPRSQSGRNLPNSRFQNRENLPRSSVVSTKYGTRPPFSKNQKRNPSVKRNNSYEKAKENQITDSQEDSINGSSGNRNNINEQSNEQLNEREARIVSRYGSRHGSRDGTPNQRKGSSFSNAASRMKIGANHFINGVKDFLPDAKRAAIALKSFIGLLAEYSGKIRAFLAIIIGCGKAVESVLQHIINAYVGVSLLIGSAGAYAALLPKFLTNLLCNWELLVNTIQTLKLAVDALTTSDRMFYIGKFAGQLFVIFGAVFGKMEESKVYMEGFIAKVDDIRKAIEDGISNIEPAFIIFTESEKIFRRIAG